MKKLLLLAVFAFSGTIFYQCTRPAQTSSADAVKYPNKDSELALLMREMESEAMTMREAIKKGEEPKDLRTRFEAILTAQSTEASMKTPAFQVMAKNYLKSLNKVYEAPKEERLEKYTLMINDCMNCHKAQCPGPLVRIKKLNTP
ncbi:MAG: hypothetical protein EAZ95_03070 [Bacteroidetes bacterium]|nr:MAG: hypothetical protein EAZ95_03070 [Bacteroidota bacterium]